MKILVTGGCSSLGLELVRGLYSDGHEVHALAKEDNFRRPSVVCDLATLTQEKARKIIQKIEPEVLINNAGITRLAYNEDLTVESWDEVQAVNVRAPFLLSQAMLREYGGDIGTKRIIINIASMGYRAALRCSSAYNSSKAGLVMLTKQMAREAADRHPQFLFYAVSPNSLGGTGMLEQCRRALIDVRGMGPDEADKYLVASPLGHLEDTEDVVACVKFLVTHHPRYMTGTNIEHPGAGQT